MTEIPKLTQFSPGAGCGCKIPIHKLELILKSINQYTPNPNLLVGNDSKDDAAVFDIGGGKSIISTTDFFTPIVDDPTDFGEIASVNAISDIYAMGGKPIMAIAILGWPTDKLPTETAQLVIEGARYVCDKAGITLAGGHSIAIGDPIFGLAVTGIIDTNKVKQNNKATAGCKLFLTKPLGVGIITTAEKRGVVEEKDRLQALQLMKTLNSVGSELSQFKSVKAMTDVTGFGLLGHLLELCEGGNLMAKLDFDKIPTIDGLDKYIKLKTFPGGLFKNFKSNGHKVQELNDYQKYILCDPQTSGGLLVAVEEEGVEEVKKHMENKNYSFYQIGELLNIKENDKLIII